MNEREFNSKLEADFSAYLTTRGYPDGSLIFEPSIRVGERVYRPDFLVIDPNNNERLAVFEVKGKNYNIESVKEKLNSYRNAIGGTPMSAFLATPSAVYSEQNPFDLFKLKDDGKLEEIDLRLFPSFVSLSSNKAVENKKEISDRKEEATSSFDNLSKWISLSLVILVIVDFACSFFDIKFLTTERLAIIGGAVALAIIPYFHKIKLLGIELEKATVQKDK
jgi:hypothetical protein